MSVYMCVYSGVFRLNSVLIKINTELKLKKKREREGRCITNNLKYV